MVFEFRYDFFSRRKLLLHLAMEFFRIVDKQSSETEIKEQININTIPDIYPDMIVLDGHENTFMIGSFWGEFTLHRDEIMGGLRFSMLDCPNALSWTITTGYPPARDKIVIHLTINRMEKPKEFIAEINELLDGWKKGLENRF